MTAPPSPSDRSIVDRFASFIDPPSPEAPAPENNEVPQAESEPAEASPESEAPETPEVAPEPETEAQPEAEAEPEAEPDESEIRTDADIADALGIGLEDLRGNLKLEIGEESLTLSEVIERATAAPAEQVAKLAETMTTQRVQFEQTAANWTQEHQANQAAIIGLANFHLQKVEGDGALSEQSLAALKAEDPEQWAVRKEEQRQVYGQIDQLVRGARESNDKFEQQQAQMAQQRAAEEGARLLAAIPEWSENPQQAVKEAQEISGWIQREFSFSEEEMGQMPDHRLALVFRRLHQAESKLAKQAAKRKTLEGKKLTTSRSAVPAQARKVKVDPDAQRSERLRRVARETSGDVTRRREHEAVQAERFSSFMD